MILSASPPWRLALAAVTATVAMVVAITPARLQATVIIPADLVELATDAAAIAHGRVVRVEAQQGEGRRVERLVTLQVFEYFKSRGAWGNVVQFRLPGGTLGRYHTVMIGAPELAEGDEVVLFLGAAAASAREDARPFVLGLHQGVFRVVTDEASGRRLVLPPLVQGASAASAAPVRRGDVTRRPLELRDFQGRIAAALATPRVAAAGARVPLPGGAASGGASGSGTSGGGTSGGGTSGSSASGGGASGAGASGLGAAKAGPR